MDPLPGLLRVPLTQHRYLYALADPLQYVDSSGEQVQYLAGIYALAFWIGFQTEYHRQVAEHAERKGLTFSQVYPPGDPLSPRHYPEWIDLKACLEAGFNTANKTIAAIFVAMASVVLSGEGLQYVGAWLGQYRPSWGVPVLNAGSWLKDLPASLLAPPAPASCPPPSPSQLELAKEVAEWLGKDARVIVNKSGDVVFLSADGTRRLRFDFHRTAPQQSPHAHLEELMGGQWVKSGPIYPADVQPR